MVIDTIFQTSVAGRSCKWWHPIAGMSKRAIRDIERQDPGGG